MTEAEFLDWVKRLEQMQEEITSMHESIVRELAEHKKAQLVILKALEKSNKLLDQADQMDVARLLRKGREC